jgi:hypothetical protein
MAGFESTKLRSFTRRGFEESAPATRRRGTRAVVEPVPAQHLACLAVTHYLGDSVAAGDVDSAGGLSRRFRNDGQAGYALEIAGIVRNEICILRKGRGGNPRVIDRNGLATAVVSNDCPPPACVVVGGQNDISGQHSLQRSPSRGAPSSQDSPFVQLGNGHE